MFEKSRKNSARTGFTHTKRTLKIFDEKVLALFWSKEKLYTTRIQLLWFFVISKQKQSTLSFPKNVRKKSTKRNSPFFFLIRLPPRKSAFFYKKVGRLVLDQYILTKTLLILNLSENGELLQSFFQKLKKRTLVLRFCLSPLFWCILCYFSLSTFFPIRRWKKSCDENHKKKSL